jgi:GNAT superfamily N-acetyltransferase
MKRLFVRRLRSENAQAYRAVLVEGLILHPDRFVEDYRAEVARPLTDIEADLEQNGIFGAWVDEKLVGIAGYSRLRSPKRQHCGRVRALYVKERFRKNGIASRLLGDLFRHAATHIDQLEAEITTRCEGAVRLFKGEGFRICGLSRGALRVDEEELDVWTMIRWFLKRISPFILNEGVKPGHGLVDLKHVSQLKVCHQLRRRNNHEAT